MRNLSTAQYILSLESGYVQQPGSFLVEPHGLHMMHGLESMASASVSLFLVARLGLSAPSLPLGVGLHAVQSRCAELAFRVRFCLWVENSTAS